MAYTTPSMASPYASAVLLSAGATAGAVRPDFFRAPGQSIPFAGSIARYIEDFAPISLENTNKLARMLKRVDNKYVLRRSELQDFLTALQDDFSVLEIDGVKEFSYSSCYYDDNFKSYRDHHQGRRLRYKIRTRHYMDSGEIFFEVKLKDKRGETNKERISCKTFKSPTPNKKCMSMLSTFYQRLYNRQFSLDLKPALIVNCNRCTLVSRHGGERITIDYSLGFDPMNGPSVNIGPDFIIVETKSADGKGLADVALKKAGIRQAKKLSKYCVGAILTGGVTKYNNFKASLKRIRGNVIA